MTKVLEGVRVVDLGTMITAPLAGMMLADLGAVDELPALGTVGHDVLLAEALEHRRDGGEREVAIAGEVGLDLSGGGFPLLPEHAENRELKIAEAVEARHERTPRLLL